MSKTCIYEVYDKEMERLVECGEPVEVRKFGTLGKKYKVPAFPSLCDTHAAFVADAVDPRGCEGRARA